MKLFRNLLVFAVTFFAFSAVGINAQNVSGNQSQRALEEKIYKKILYLPYYGAFDSIKFQVEGSKVILSGKVINSINKSDAKNAVEDIDGVSEVVNNIDLLPLSSFDNQIRFRLAREIGNSAGIGRYVPERAPSVRIIVENGRITLEGYVSNRSDSNLLNILANGIPGVFSVQNNLIVNKEMVR